MARPPALLFALWTLACVGGDGARDETVRSVFGRADEALLRSRPALTASRYARMAASPVAFYRGQVALFLRDWRDAAMGLSRSSFAHDLPMPLGVGDPHVENFGTLVGRAGDVTLEANDLDGADRVPFLWDLRRLTVGLCVAARASNGDSLSAQRALADASGAVVRAAALAYADGLRLEATAPRAEVPVGTVLDDLFRRARRDVPRRTELTDRTTLTAGVRRLVRGPIDPDDPTNVQTELPAWATASLPALLASYRLTLPSPPDAGYFTVLDAVREFGSGVASLPRVRVIALVRGPTDAPDDDVLLEVKEQTDAITPGAPPPTVYAESVPARVLAARAALWSRADADPLWGTGVWFGAPVQVRRETGGAKSVRVARMTGPLGTPEALTALAQVLAARLAHMHRRTLPSPAPQLARIAANPQEFAREEADVAVRYAAVVFDDHARFARLVLTYGPTLGFPYDPVDVPNAAIRSLFGTPP
jgi:uncharacterized protein (DUF2252 family)